MALAILLLALAAVLVSTVRRALTSSRAAVCQAAVIIVTATANLVVLVTTRDTATHAINLAASATLVAALYRWSFTLRARHVPASSARRDADSRRSPGGT